MTTLHHLTHSQLPDISAALSAANLPVADLDLAGRVFFRCESATGVVGYGGLELYGTDALLRSVVVPTQSRGQGQGALLVRALEAHARQNGVVRMWLLTTTAAAFFDKQAYARFERALAPPAIAASHEFTSLCPASAVCMVKNLTP